MFTRLNGLKDNKTYLQQSIHFLHCIKLKILGYIIISYYLLEQRSINDNFEFV